MVLPNLKHLQYLLALHKHQHFNRAAAACFVSQSTLSSAILKLEEQLNCQLIERDHKAFIFTAQGLEIVKMAKDILVSTSDLVSYAQHQGSSDEGSIRIGCIHTIAPYLLTDFVQLCQRELPDVSLYLSENSTENLMLMLENGEIDLIILALPVLNNGFKTKIVGQDQFYIAGDKLLIDQYMQSENYQDLPTESVFLLSQEHCLTKHAVSACQLVDKSRINSFLASSVSTLIQMTAYHKGITFLPKIAVTKQVGVAEGLTIKLLPKNMYRDIGVMWRTTSARQKLYVKIAGLVSKLIK